LHCFVGKASNAATWGTFKRFTVTIPRTQQIKDAKYLQYHDDQERKPVCYDG